MTGPGYTEAEICKAGIGGAFAFSDGSLIEGGNVGGGAYIVGTDGQEQEVEIGIGGGVRWRDGRGSQPNQDNAGKEGSHTR